MFKRRPWIIPVSTAVLFALLCFYAVQTHDTVWAVLALLGALINVYLAYRWFTERRAPKR
jgi:hypothetical protein